MTSIFAKIESAVAADVSTAVSDLEIFFTADVWPIMKAVFTYLEQNAGSDLLKIATNAFNAAVSGLETGTAPASVATAVIGTVLDEAKSAGIQVAEGAAALAVSMAAAAVNSNASTTTAPPPPPVTAAAPTPTPSA